MAGELTGRWKLSDSFAKEMRRIPVINMYFCAVMWGFDDFAQSPIEQEMMRSNFKWTTFANHSYVYIALISTLVGQIECGFYELKVHSHLCQHHNIYLFDVFQSNVMGQSIWLVQLKILILKLVVLL
jgi:hypothetical protein